MVEDPTGRRPWPVGAVGAASAAFAAESTVPAPFAPEGRPGPKMVLMAQSGRTHPVPSSCSRLARTTRSLHFRRNARPAIGILGGRQTRESLVSTRLSSRMWRIGVAVAPFIALALSLEAGRRWF